MKCRYSLCVLGVASPFETFVLKETVTTRIFKHKGHNDFTKVTRIIKSIRHRKGFSPEAISYTEYLYKKLFLRLLCSIRK